MPQQFPSEWKDKIVEWANRTPLVTEVYLFGSRAKGCACDDSDIDLAYRTKPSGSDSAFTIAIFNGSAWKAELQALLPRPVDLQYADPDEDIVVWPAVMEHGIRIV